MAGVSVNEKLAPMPVGMPVVFPMPAGAAATCCFVEPTWTVAASPVVPPAGVEDLRLDLMCARLAVGVACGGLAAGLDAGDLQAPSECVDADPPAVVEVPGDEAQIRTLELGGDRQRQPLPGLDRSGRPAQRRLGRGRHAHRPGRRGRPPRSVGDLERHLVLTGVRERVDREGRVLPDGRDGRACAAPPRAREAPAVAQAVAARGRPVERRLHAGPHGAVRRDDGRGAGPVGRRGRRLGGRRRRTGRRWRVRAVEDDVVDAPRLAVVAAARDPEEHDPGGVHAEGPRGAVGAAVSLSVPSVPPAASKTVSVNGTLTPLRLITRIEIDGWAAVSRPPTSLIRRAGQREARAQVEPPDVGIGCRSGGVGVDDRLVVRPAAGLRAELDAARGVLRRHRRPVGEVVEPDRLRRGTDADGQRGRDPERRGGPEEDDSQSAAHDANLLLGVAGRGKHERRSALGATELLADPVVEGQADRDRDVALQIAGWTVVRFTWRQVVHDPDRRWSPGSARCSEPPRAQPRRLAPDEQRDRVVAATDGRGTRASGGRERRRGRSASDHR